MESALTTARTAMGAYSLFILRSDLVMMAGDVEVPAGSVISTVEESMAFFNFQLVDTSVKLWQYRYMTLPPAVSSY